VKALFTADWHLKASDRIWESVPNLRGDLPFILDQLSDFIVHEGIEEVYLLGDIFDKPVPTSWAVDQLLRFCRQCNNTGIYFVQGQHDYSNPPWLEVLGAGKHIDSCRAFNAENGYGLDLVYSQDKLSVPADVDTLLTHQCWTEFMGEYGFVTASLLPVNTVISGDFHFAKCLKLENMTIYSIGILVPRRVNEISAPSVLIYDNGDYHFHRDFQAREMVVLEYSGDEESHNRIIERLKELSDTNYDYLPVELRTPLVVIYHSRDVSYAIETLKSKYNKLCILSRSLSKYKTVDSPDTFATSSSIIEFLSCGDSQVAEDMTRLCRCNNLASIQGAISEIIHRLKDSKDSIEVPDVLL